MQYQIAVNTLRDKDNSLAYWRSRPVEERIAAVEALRDAYYAHLPQNPKGVQRVCIVTQRTKD